MAYTSLQYAGFLAIFFLLYTVTPRKAKWVTLLVASMSYYLLAARKLVLVILFTSLVIYLSALCLSKIEDGAKIARAGIAKEQKKEFRNIIKWQKKFICAIAIVISLGLLAFLKYYGFFASAIGRLLAMARLSALPEIRLLLPLGISFYTLQCVGYLIDVYRGKYRAQTNYAKFLLFVSFFPQITEGPIGRYDALSGQLYEWHKFNYDGVMSGLTILLFGYFKKSVIADRAAILVTTVFSKPDDYSGFYIVAATVMYTIQLYADFSGCIDICTGSAKLFGIDLAPNFRQPFFSKSVSEFWRRWHISLGEWFKDYLFYPVSLSKPFMALSSFTQKHLNDFFGSLVPASAALFVVWFSTGLWHGASYKYIAYGLYYFVIILLGMLTEPIFARVYGKLHISRTCIVYKALQIIRTVIFVNIGMLLFRANTFMTFVSMLRSTFRGFTFSTLTDGSLLTLGADIYDFCAIGAGVLIMLVVGIIKERGVDLRGKIAVGPFPVRWIVFLFLILSVAVFGTYGPNYAPVDFLYAQF